MPEKRKILVVDDDTHIAELISLYLNKEGYDTREVYTGSEAVGAFKEYSPHMAILDLMLPGMDGIEICAEIRKISESPIIMLTARGETGDKVLGLGIGADDYIVKPFEPKELIARVKAVFRRYTKADTDRERIIVLPNLTINQTRYNVIYHGKEMALPPKEFELLFYLASNPNRVFSREDLLNKIWGYDFVGETRTVDVHVKRLREKMPYEDVWEIKTVHGVGYKMQTV